MVNYTGKRYPHWSVSIIVLLIILSVYGSALALSPDGIRCNQLGFYLSSQKRAIVPTVASEPFYVVAQGSGDTVFSGQLSASSYWSASEETVSVADFSLCSVPGTFVIIAGGKTSWPFIIGKDVHDAVVRGSAKAFYYNRCSSELTQEFAGVYARKTGHPDTAVRVHNSAESATRPAGTVLASPGGWYDAGDYGKYIVNSGITTSTLLAAYEAYPSYFDTLRLHIPESSNSIPDIVDEALFNIRWMLTMQDPVDGGVYHKLTSAGFCGMVMPDEDNLQRYVVAKSTAATLDFAAVCAQASRILRQFEAYIPGVADSCLDAATRAWEWARTNPAVYYKNSATSSPKISTGEYGDGNATDELTWAATELYIATEQDSFATVVFGEGELSGVNSVPSWPNVGTLALYSLLLSESTAPGITKNDITDAITDLADSILALLSQNPYHIMMDTRDFGWGSNSTAANRGMVLLMAYRATQTAAYLSAAIDQLDYLLGRNPLDISFVTGFGAHTPLHVHHRPSESDTVTAPVPGFLAGGPNRQLQDTANCNYYLSSLPALAYVDSACSYASNEIAINWNAPLVFLTGGIEALMRTESSAVGREGLQGMHRTVPVVQYRNGVVMVNGERNKKLRCRIYNLQGKMLADQQGWGTMAVVAVWPPQVVCISIYTSEGVGRTTCAANYLLCGN